LSLIQHPATGFDIGDPEKVPLTQGDAPSHGAVLEAAQHLVLSPSGWRKVFASPMAGDAWAPWSDRMPATGAASLISASCGASASGGADDSLSPNISPADRVICALMAKTFGDFILARRARAGDSNGAAVRPAVILGIDSRPTGPAIADIFARVLLGMSIDLHYCFIIAAPEIMAFAAKSGALPAGDSHRADGFAYISASHNPPGHNGVKFGLASGGVLSPAEVTPLIASLKELLQAESCIGLALDLIGAAPPRELGACYVAVSGWKRQAVSAYTLFTHEVVTARPDLETQSEFLDGLAAECEKRPIGIVGELNGSARSLSIDKDYLEGLGIRTRWFNDSPRAFAHRIVPEGASLSPCALRLQEIHGTDPAFELGYVPDCDGDRGNLVYFDRREKKAKPLEAQEVFALSCVAELATSALAQGGGATRPAGTVAAEAAGKFPDKRERGQESSGGTAIVVNDATSMRIDKIAGMFGAHVFRAETGEANVVALADALRSRGWTVRILGEGSNGGNITHPAKVRDPLSTLGAMIKLLRLKEKSSGKDLFMVWLATCGRAHGDGENYDCETAGQAGPYRADYGLSDIIATLPRWATTSVFEERAVLKVKTADHAALKAAYRDIFLREWEQRKDILRKRFGIERWRALASNGTCEKEVGDDFAQAGRGGLRIVFSGHPSTGPRDEAADGAQKQTDSDQDLAFLWLRGSGTEPVLRVMADIDGGGPADEAFLLEWHTRMVREADR